MKTIRRWLAGEVVNNTTGIKIVGGPFKGQIKIVRLRPDGTPLSPLPAPGRQVGPTRHVYEAARSTRASAGLVYTYLGVEPTPTVEAESKLA
ncbi:hypothetical protein ACFQ0G_45750 [Streptomyces chiangmaiensis]